MLTLAAVIDSRHGWNMTDTPKTRIGDVMPGAGLEAGEREVKMLRAAQGLPYVVQLVATHVVWLYNHWDVFIGRCAHLSLSETD